MNLVSIADGCSYFVCHDPAVQSWLAQLLGVTFDGAVAKATRMWLRKEIIKQELTQSQ